MAETTVVITNNISGVIKELENNLKERMGNACVLVKQKATDSMREPKHGAVYTTYFFTRGGKVIPIGKRWKPHQASAPGEAPAIDTGELAQHIFVSVNDKGTEGEVGIPSGIQSKQSPKTTIGEIGKGLEYGTSRVAARPWLKPAFENSKNDIIKIFTAPME